MSGVWDGGLHGALQRRSKKATQDAEIGSIISFFIVRVRIFMSDFIGLLNVCLRGIPLREAKIILYCIFIQPHI